MKKIQILGIIMTLNLCGVNIYAQNTINGTNAGNAGYYNTSIGYYAGDVVTGNYNSSLGAYAGKNMTSGMENTFVGSLAGRYTTTGYRNTSIGYKANCNNTTGKWNVSVGGYSGNFNQTGEYNVYLGYVAGHLNTGSRNVFLGFAAGYNELGSNKLYIENSTSTDPLIYGEFDDDLLSVGGRLGIGTRNVPDSIRLAVDGTIIAKEVIITIDNFPDYVFEKNYRLRSLSELESFISMNGHLPEVPSAKQVEEDGVKLGEMDAILLKKIEELTLYVIEMGKDNEKLQVANRELTERLQGIESINGDN